MTRRPVRFTSRAHAIAQLRAELEAGSWPRAQMMLMVALTGASGFVASFLLLAMGMAAMGLRYLLACTVAYACFLVLLAVWIRWRRESDGSGDLTPDLSNLPDLSGMSHPQGWSGGGGRSGGGGASAEFDAPVVAEAPMHSLLGASPGREVKGAGGFDFDFDLDAAAVPILLVVLVAGLVLSSLFVVWGAPALLAEVLLDGALAAGLYRRLRHIERRHWLETALRKTVWPFVLTALVLALVGFGLQAAVPQADSIGDVLPLLDKLAR